MSLNIQTEMELWFCLKEQGYDKEADRLIENDIIENWGLLQTNLLILALSKFDSVKSGKPLKEALPERAYPKYPYENKFSSRSGGAK